MANEQLAQAAKILDIEMRDLAPKSLRDQENFVLYQKEALKTERADLAGAQRALKAARDRVAQLTGGATTQGSLEWYMLREEARVKVLQYSQKVLEDVTVSSSLRSKELATQKQIEMLEERLRILREKQTKPSVPGVGELHTYTTGKMGPDGEVTLIPID